MKHTISCRYLKSSKFNNPVFIVDSKDDKKSFELVKKLGEKIHKKNENQYNPISVSSKNKGVAFIQFNKHKFNFVYDTIYELTFFPIQSRYSVDKISLMITNAKIIDQAYSELDLLCSESDSE